jgi:flagellar hook-length control protein FliK
VQAAERLAQALRALGAGAEGVVPDDGEPLGAEAAGLSRPGRHLSESGGLRASLLDAVAGPASSPQAQPAAARVAPGMAPVPPAIPHALGDPAWGQALGDRVLWMVGRDVQHAEVRLNPPHLGPLEVRVSVHNDQASVSFNAQHPLTRDVLEAAIPRLREMLQEADLDLVSVDVGQGGDSGPADGRRREPGSPAEPFPAAWGRDELPPAEGRPMRLARSGLVDDFA